eukprot:g8546.t1
MLLESMLFVGLDIGGTNIKAGVLDGSTGHLIGNPLQEPLPKLKRSPELVVDRLVSLARSLLDEHGITWADTLYVGIACPGQIDREKGIVVAASSFPSWNNVPLGDMVQAKVSRPVTVLNDASAAASAEFAGRGSRETIAVLTLGTGIGLGVVCAGRVLTGCRGLIEGGHMIVEPGPNGRPCACGQRGCLETYASASAVATIASERLKSGLAAAAPGLSPSGEGLDMDVDMDMDVEKIDEDRVATPPATPVTPTNASSPRGSRRKASLSRSDSAVSLRIRELERRTSEAEKERSAPSTPRMAARSAAAVDADPMGKVTAADVFAMAKQGDEVAVRVVEETCDYLGLACVNICRMLDPDAILLTGGLSKAEGLVDKVRSAFSSKGWNVLPHECEIDVASTCVAAGVIGAAGAASCEYSLARRRNRRRSSDGNVGYAAAGAGSGDGKRGTRGWGVFLVGVGLGALVAGIVSGRSGRGSSR